MSRDILKLVNGRHEYMQLKKLNGGMVYQWQIPIRIRLELRIATDTRHKYAPLELPLVLDLNERI